MKSILLLLAMGSVAAFSHAASSKYERPISTDNARIEALLNETQSAEAGNGETSQSGSMWLYGRVYPQTTPIPFLEAARALIPNQIGILISQNLDGNTLVTWTDGTIKTALKEIMTVAEASYRISDRGIQIDSVKPTKSIQQIAWPRFVPTIAGPLTEAAGNVVGTIDVKPIENDRKITANPTNVQKVSAQASPSLEMKENPRKWWVIKKGESLQTVLSFWSQSENIKLEWPGAGIAATETMQIYGTFDHMLNQVFTQLNKNGPVVEYEDEFAKNLRTVRISLK
jgi:hypothetical protein